MRILLLIIGLLLSVVIILVCYHGIRIYWLDLHSKELVKKSVAFQQLIADGSPRILIIGDSTGVGTGVDDPKTSIAGRLGTDFPHAYIQNESVNGATVADALQSFPAVSDKSFDIVLLQIGANDILRATAMPQFSASLDQLFKKSTAAGKQVYALHSGNMGLAPMFQWPVSTVMRSRTLTYRQEYRRIAADNGVIYVDLYHEKADDPFQGKHEFYASDLLHLSGAGYGEWYRTLRSAMDK